MIIINRNTVMRWLQQFEELGIRILLQEYVEPMVCFWILSIRSTGMKAVSVTDRESVSTIISSSITSGMENVPFFEWQLMSYQVLAMGFLF